MGDLHDLYRSWQRGEHKRRFEPLETCPRCDGDGFVFGDDDWVICPVCNGSRMVIRG